MSSASNDLDSVDVSTLSKAKRKKHKKLKKDYEKQKARKEREKKRKKNNMIKISIVAGIILVLAIFLKSRSDSQTKMLSFSPSLELIPANRDLGTISSSNGVVETSFTIKNTGKGELKISSIVTSCMCTTAKIVIDGKESPKFGMHNNAPWAGTIQPGSSAELRVAYDPNFHKNTRGEITRFISFSTNDPHNKQAKVRFKTIVTA